MTKERTLGKQQPLGWKTVRLEIYPRTHFTREKNFTDYGTKD
jgi:hypothetical protein